MIYTITVNPAIDYVVEVKDIIPGKTNRAKSEGFRPGGKGINVSIILNHLGIESIALGFAGGPTGYALNEMLKEECINSHLIMCDGNTRINVKMKCVTETEINGKGVTVSKENILQLRRYLDILMEGDYVVLAGHVAEGVDKGFYGRAVNVMTSKGVECIVDAEGEMLLNALPFRPFLIKPNEQELADMFLQVPDNVDRIEFCARKLHAMGAKNVIISLGANGAVMLTEEGEYLVEKAPVGETVNTVGAGDTMIAAFMAAYLRTGDKKRAFRFCVEAASATAFTSWLATTEQIEEAVKDKELIQILKDKSFSAVNQNIKQSAE